MTAGEKGGERKRRRVDGGAAGKGPSDFGRSGVRSRAAPHRDQDQSTFSRILDHLVAAVPGARGAALVDWEGETVDYAGFLEVYELKVAAAAWQIAFREVVTEAPHAAATTQIIIRAKTASYVIRRIQANYAVVLVLHRAAAFAASERALQEADARLSVEAGFDKPMDAARWFSVEVETSENDRSRPARIRLADGWQSVEVMGALVGLRPKEKGFRIRLAKGAEMMLVRERFGRWFSDEHIEE